MRSIFDSEYTLLIVFFGCYCRSITLPPANFYGGEIFSPRPLFSTSGELLAPADVVATSTCAVADCIADLLIPADIACIVAIVADIRTTVGACGSCAIASPCDATNAAANNRSCVRFSTLKTPSPRFCFRLFLTIFFPTGI